MKMENSTNGSGQAMVKENKMGYMPEGRLLINMSLPMMISMLVQALYNITDSYFVGKYSEDAFQAVTAAFPLQMLMVAIGSGTGVGVNALVSRALGEKNNKKASVVAKNGLFIFLISYIVTAIVGTMVIRPFLFTQVDEGGMPVINLGTTYLSIVLIFSFGIYGQFIFERLLQSTGKTIFTMVSQTTGAIVNLILDPLLIFGIGFFPRMGIAGAATATVIGQIFAAVIALIWNVKKNHELNLNLKGFRPNASIIAHIYKIAVPSIIMQSIGSVMTFSMYLVLKPFGKAAQMVFGSYFKLQSFFFMPVFGLNNGLIPILSFNYGARNKKRMLRTMKFGYIIAGAFMVVGFAVFMAVPDLLIKIFSASDEMVEISKYAFRIIALHFLLAWFCIVCGSLFQAIGKAIFSMTVSIARQLVVLVPVAKLFAVIGGIHMVWWCFPIAELMSLTISSLWLFRVKRKILDAM